MTRSKDRERELAFIERCIHDAEQSAPSDRLIRQALLSGELSTDTVRAAANDEVIRKYLGAWLAANEEAALAGEEHVLSIEEVAARVMGGKPA